MLKDGKLKWETKLGEIAEQAHLFLLYKSVLPVSSDAKLFQNRSFPREDVHRALTLSTLCGCALLDGELCVTVGAGDASKGHIFGALSFTQPWCIQATPGLSSSPKAVSLSLMLCCSN